eukprot:scaffold165747_cov27-Tisochrysis_lutea.AAC.2
MVVVRPFGGSPKCSALVEPGSPHPCPLAPTSLRHNYSKSQHRVQMSDLRKARSEVRSPNQIAPSCAGRRQARWH